MCTGRQANSLERALCGVAMGRSTRARIAPYMNASAFCVRAGQEPQNSMPYRRILFTHESRMRRMAELRRPRSLRRDSARSTLNA